MTSERKRHGRGAVCLPSRKVTRGSNGVRMTRERETWSGRRMRTVKESDAGLEGCADDASGEVLEAAAGPVLHLLAVQVVEQGVHGEVAALRVLRRRPDVDLHVSIDKMKERPQIFRLPVLICSLTCATSPSICTLICAMNCILNRTGVSAYLRDAGRLSVRFTAQVDEVQRQAAEVHRGRLQVLALVRVGSDYPHRGRLHSLQDRTQ